MFGHAGGSDLFLGMKELRREAKEPGVDKENSAVGNGDSGR
jgi:hypothetical protein